MNPLMITGVLTVAILSVALLVSFSGEHVRYSGVIEQTSSMQAERLQENVSVEMRDGQLYVQNTGSVPVRIMEVRLLDSEGAVAMRQKVDLHLPVAQDEAISGIDPLLEPVRRVLAG